MAGPTDNGFWRSRVLRTGAPQFVNPYGQHITAYAAARVIATNISALHLHTWTGPPDEEERERTENKSIADFLRKPNPILDRQKFLTLMVLQLLITGESWNVLLDVMGQPVEDLREVPRWLWLKDGDAIACDTPLHDGEANTFGGKVYRDRASRKPLLMDAHLPIMLVNPKNPWRGIGPLEVGAHELRADWAAQRYNEAFFDNSAIPDGVLSSKQPIQPEQRVSLREQFEQRHRGISKSHKIAILGNGMEFSRMGDTMKDMEFEKGRRFTREQVAILTGVPESEMGHTTDTKYFNGLTGNLGLWSGVLLPIMEAIESALNDPMKGIAQRFDPTGRTWIGFDHARIAALMDAVGDKIGHAKELRAMGYPMDEVNARVGLGMSEGLPGMDIGWLKANELPIPEILAMLEEEEPEDDDEPDDADDTTPQEDEDDEEDVVDADDEDAKDAGAYRGCWPTRGHMMRAVKDEIRKAWDRHERQAKARVTKYLREYRKAMLGRVDAVVKATLAERHGVRLDDPVAQPEAVEARFLRSLAQGDAVVLKTTAEELLLPEGTWKKKLRAQMVSVYGSAVASAADTVELELGGLQEFDLNDPSIGKFLKNTADKVVAIETTIRTDLRKSLAIGLQNGESVAELKTRVRDVMNATNSRARTIARTESGMAMNGGRHEVMKAEGVAGSEWSAFIDATTRDSHVSINGEIVKLGKQFSNGLKYPLDPTGDAEEIINCRCVALTIEADEMPKKGQTRNERKQAIRAVPGSAPRSRSGRARRIIRRIRELARNATTLHAPAGG